jgi:hypothetical protein
MNGSGDDQSGFTVGYDPVRGAVEVTGFGFWSAEVANDFSRKVTASFRDRPGTRELVLDMSALRPMRDEGQRALAELLRMLPKLGVLRLRITTASHLTKLQLLRIVTDTSAGAQVEWRSGSEDRAGGG